MSDTNTSSETQTSTINAGGGGDSITAPAAETAQKDWFAELPDDLKSQPGVTRHKTLTDAIQAGIAAEKRLGVPADQLLRLPTKPDDKEAVTTIYKALGAPDAPEGYQIQWEGQTDAEKAVVGEYAKFMHEKGPFPPDALAAAAEFWRGKVAEQATAEAAQTEAARVAAEGALKTEFGDKYEPAKTAVAKLIVDLGGEKLAQELDLNAQVGNNPELFRFLHKLTEKMAEPGPTADGKTATTGAEVLTPQEAKFQRAALESDPVKGKALRDGSHPMHAAVVEERNKLLKAENPQTAAA